MPTEPTTETPGASQPAPPPQGNRFFAWMRSIGLSRQPGWIGGVASGIALRLNIDPLIVRGIIVVVALLGAPALLLYAAAWMLLPDHTGKIHAEELGRGRFEPPVAGAGVMVLLELLPGANLAFPFIGPFFPWWGGEVWPFAVWDGFWGVLWTLAIIGSAIWLVVALANRSGSAPSTPMPPAGHAGAPSDAPTAAYPTVEYPTAATASSSSATVPLVSTDAPEAPTDPTDLAAWQQQQAKFKQERDEFVRTDAETQRAAMLATAAERQREAAARAAAYRAEHERTRSHPLFTLTAIGISLIVGALAMFIVGDGTITEQSMTAGLASMLAVLAVAIIINGIIGKRSGGSSGLAVIVTIVLLATSISPFGSHATLFGNSSYSAQYTEDREETYFSGFGQTTIDLEDYWQGAPSGNGEIRVFSGFGDVTVIVPDAGHVLELDLHLGAGQLEVEGGTADQSGLFRSLNETLPSDAADRRSVSERELTVQVYAGFGDVTITTEGASR